MLINVNHIFFSAKPRVNFDNAVHDFIETTLHAIPVNLYENYGIGFGYVPQGEYYLEVDMKTFLEAVMELQENVNYINFDISYEPHATHNHVMRDSKGALKIGNKGYDCSYYPLQFKLDHWV